MIAYEKDTGKERWRSPMTSGSDLVSLTFAQEYIVIKQIQGVRVIHRETGQSTRLTTHSATVVSMGEATFIVGSLKPGGDIRVCRLDSTESGPVLTPVTHSGQEVRLNPEVNTFSGVALADTQVLAMENYASKKLVATPWRDPGTSWTYEQEDDGKLIPLGRLRVGVIQETSPFHRIRGSFLPISVYYELPHEILTHDLKLIVIDLRDGEVKWESPKVRQDVNGLKMYSAMYQGGVYRIHYVSAEGVTTELLLDGASGEWQRALSFHLQFEKDEFVWSNQILNEELFDGERILGFVRDTIYSYHWKSGMLYVQGSGQVRVVDEFPTLAEKLKLPTQGTSKDASGK